MLKRFKKMFFDKQQINIEVYRCDSCHGIITNFDIAKLNKKGEGDICRCGQNQFRPTNPSLTEKILIVLRYIIKGY